MKNGLDIPKIEFSKKIHFGSTEKEITEAFEMYKEKMSQKEIYDGVEYEVLKYTGSNGESMELTLDKTYGLVKIRMNRQQYDINRKETTFQWSLF